MKTLGLALMASLTLVLAACGASDTEPEVNDNPDLDPTAEEEQPGVVLGDEGDEGEDTGDYAKTDSASKKCGPGLAACASGQTCNIQSCASGATGLCVTKPLPNNCPVTWAPVCGCDGKSYGNDCVRIRAGAKKKADGACKNIKCGPTGACPKDMICDKREFQMDDFPPLTKSYCVPKPKACPTAVKQVCGGDALSGDVATFKNDCERILKGVPFNHAGACTDADFKALQ